MGPFYCSADQTVYIDLDFFKNMEQTIGASGDFTYAYVIAHEVGHHVQYLLAGRPAPVLPDNFDQVYQQWQEGALSVRKAAGACGMTESSFYYAATRKARSAQAT